MIIPAKNAFTINRLANRIGEYFFPFSINVSQKGDVSRIFVCAQRVIDLCDLINKHALNNLAIVGVDQSTYTDKITNRQVSIEALAVNAKVPYSLIDTENIVLRKDCLEAFISAFYHWNLHLFDMPDGWNELDIVDNVLTYREHDFTSQQSILPELTGSRFFLRSHDDCYLNIESYSRDLSREVFTRALLIFTGTVMARKNIPISDLPDFPRDLVDTFWKDDFGLTIFEDACQLEDDRLILGVSKQSYNFREAADYTPEFWIVYDLQHQHWLVQT